MARQDKDDPPSTPHTHTHCGNHIIVMMTQSQCRDDVVTRDDNAIHNSWEFHANPRIIIIILVFWLDGPQVEQRSNALLHCTASIPTRTESNCGHLPGIDRIFLARNPNTNMIMCLMIMNSERGMIDRHCVHGCRFILSADTPRTN